MVKKKQKTLSHQKHKSDIVMVTVFMLILTDFCKQISTELKFDPKNPLLQPVSNDFLALTGGKRYGSNNVTLVKNVYIVLFHPFLNSRSCVTLLPLPTRRNETSRWRYNVREVIL